MHLIVDVIFGIQNLSNTSIHVSRRQSEAVKVMHVFNARKQ